LASEVAAAAGAATAPAATVIADAAVGEFAVDDDPEAGAVGRSAADTGAVELA
jgi:hypothetical protein